MRWWYCSLLVIATCSFWSARSFLSRTVSCRSTKTKQRSSSHRHEVTLPADDGTTLESIQSRGKSSKAKLLRLVAVCLGAAAFPGPNLALDIGSTMSSFEMKAGINNSTTKTTSPATAPNAAAAEGTSLSAFMAKPGVRQANPLTHGF